MLQTKFHGNRPADFREDILKVFTVYGRGGHLDHVISIITSNFDFLVPESFHAKFGSKRHCSF